LTHATGLTQIATFVIQAHMDAIMTFATLQIHAHRQMFVTTKTAALSKIIAHASKGIIVILIMENAMEKTFVTSTTNVGRLMLEISPCFHKHDLEA
jgi:hypothetical protein